MLSKASYATSLFIIDLNTAFILAQVYIRVSLKQDNSLAYFWKLRSTATSPSLIKTRREPEHKQVAATVAASLIIVFVFKNKKAVCG